MKKIHKILRFSDIEGDNIFFNVMLMHTFDNIGQYSDFEGVFNQDNSQKVLSLTEKFSGLKSANIQQYLSPNTVLTYQTNSKLDVLKPYGSDKVINRGFTTNIDNFIDETGKERRMGNIILDSTISPIGIKYEYGVGVDLTSEDKFLGIGKGIKYKDSDGVSQAIYNTQGNNLTNSTLKHIIKEEYLMGIVDVLETKSDIFINRGQISGSETMFKMADINNLTQLTDYGNGYFNIIKHE